MDNIKNWNQFLNESKADKMASINKDTIGAIKDYSDERWRLFSGAVNRATSDEELEMALRLDGFYDRTINIAKELFNKL